MAQQLGRKGCLNADLVISQAQGLSFEIVHVDDESGDPIDHTGEQAWCRMQRAKHEDVVLDAYVSMADAAEGVVHVDIPGSVTAGIATGDWVWDLFVGETRLAYGKARVYDTYAKDGE